MNTLTMNKLLAVSVYHVTLLKTHTHTHTHTHTYTKTYTHTLPQTYTKTNHHTHKLFCALLLINGSSYF
jgi:hypothetical protein